MGKNGMADSLSETTNICQQIDVWFNMWFYIMMNKGYTEDLSRKTSLHVPNWILLLRFLTCDEMNWNFFGDAFLYTLGELPQYQLELDAELSFQDARHVLFASSLWKNVKGFLVFWWVELNLIFKLLKWNFRLTSFCSPFLFIFS